MKRRSFLQVLAAAGFGAGLGARPAMARAQADGRVAADADLRDVDPYFLDAGDIDVDEQANIAQYVAYQEQLQQGAQAVMPRGGRPKRAPSYRMLRWDGELGSADGRLVGPLSVQPVLGPAAGYQLNAQILGFRTAAAEWRGSRRGTLTIELRARLGGEPMTWLYAQEFEVDAGSSTLGLEHIGQRHGAPDPIVTDEPGIDLRIQLMRQPRRADLLSKVFKVWSLVTGLAALGMGGPLAVARETPAPLRIPRLLPEGVAFSQALFGSLSDDLPVWRSGFTSYALAAGAGRLAFAPGLWVVIDETQEVDLRGTLLEDRGGYAALTRDGVPIEANHMVLSLEISEMSLPGHLFPTRGRQDPADVVPKHIPGADQDRS